MNTPKFNDLLDTLFSNLLEEKFKSSDETRYVFNDYSSRDFAQLGLSDNEELVWRVIPKGEEFSGTELLNYIQGDERTKHLGGKLFRVLTNLLDMGVVETSSASEEAPEEIESFDDNEEGMDPDEAADDYMRGDYDEEEDDYLMDSLQEAKKSYSAKEARKGKDIGKKGKMFSKIAKSAAKKYGSKEAGKKVAGAILKKLRQK